MRARWLWPVAVAAGLLGGRARAADDAQAEAASIDAAALQLGGLEPIETFAAANGMSVRIAAPKGWVGQASDASFLDVSELPGAKVALSRAWTGPRQSEGELGRVYPDSMLLVCVQAPPSEWAPGMEELVFERMNQLVRDELGKKSSLDSFSAAPAQRRENHFRQTFQAHGELGAGHRRGEARVLTPERADRPHNHARDTGLHILAVPVVSQQMVACTLACGETEHPDQKVFACDASVSSIELLGELSAEPEMTFAGRFVVGVRKHPVTVLGMAVGVALMLIGAGAVVVAMLRARAAKITG
jgi:hypothetical protein